MSAAIEGMACVCSAVGDVVNAARLFGAREALYAGPHHAILPALDADHARFRDDCVRRLGTAEFRMLHETGAALHTSEAIQLALQQPTYFDHGEGESLIMQQ